MSEMQSVVVGSASAAGKKILISSSVLALALGAGLAASPAYAGTTIYHPNQYIGQGDSFTFGPNGDEFTLTNLGSGFGCCFVFFENLKLQGNVTASENNVADNSESTNLRRYFDGDQVDEFTNFQDFGTDSPSKGSSVYYGLQIIPGVDSLQGDPFGAVHVIIDDNGGLFVDEFAFQTGPNAPQPIPFRTPEPGTLALFAMGASALIGARRRRKGKAAV